MKKRHVTLEDCIRQHKVDVSLFTPFAIHRMRSSENATSATFTVTLHNVHGVVSDTQQLTINWSKMSDTLQQPPIQPHIISEWAACGIACAVVNVYTDLIVANVAQLGESFDYWLRDDVSEYGLEVSGMMSGSLTKRHRAKVRQLMANPLQVAGYVCVVGFHQKHIYFSYHTSKLEA